MVEKRAKKFGQCPKENVFFSIDPIPYRILLTRVDESCALYSSPDHIGLKVEKTNLEYVKNEVD